MNIIECKLESYRHESSEGRSMQEEDETRVVYKGSDTDSHAMGELVINRVVIARTADRAASLVQELERNRAA